MSNPFWERKKIEIAGSGQGGLLALCAALYLPVESIEAYRTLASFEGYFENINYILEETSVIPGLLNICDISGLTAAVDANVRFIDPIDEARNIIGKDAARKLFGTKIEFEYSKRADESSCSGGK